jgi:hypothetical protein
VGTCHAMGGHGWAWVDTFMLWVGMGGHRALQMVMVWVWIQFRRRMLGSAKHYIHTIFLLIKVDIQNLNMPSNL